MPIIFASALPPVANVSTKRWCVAPSDSFVDAEKGRLSFLKPIPNAALPQLKWG